VAKDLGEGWCWPGGWQWFIIYEFATIFYHYYNLKGNYLAYNGIESDTVVCV
jgi:hypothetical protein